jgi:protein-L-isoaspartate(D-aspartate) O-methyltransferase
MTTQAHRARLVLELRREGISDTAVLAAIERVPREMFVPEALRDQAYSNTALPIGYGQTLSQPLVVARMVEALELDDRTKVLEIGTGSGYHAAVIAQLCRRVYTIERHRPLLVEAERRFAKLRATNITAMVGDGMLGWPEQAPFERISVAAAAPEVPPALIEQLGEGAIMVLPVGERDDVQHLVKLRRRGDVIERESMVPVRFVPLVAGVAASGS